MRDLVAVLEDCWDVFSVTKNSEPPPSNVMELRVDDPASQELQGKNLVGAAKEMVLNVVVGLRCLLHSLLFHVEKMKGGYMKINLQRIVT